MATWNETRYERPAPVNRLRDFLVMGVFSLAALAAAFAFVQLKYADGNTDPASSRGPVEASARVPPSQAVSAQKSMQPAAEAQALSEVRTELGRVRGEIEAAMARISELEAAVQELQAAPAHDRRADPDARPLSRAEPPAGADATTAVQPARADANEVSTRDESHVKGEDIAPSESKEIRYIVQAGDSAAKVASRHCLSLADLLRLNPAVQDPNTLAVGQALSVEARCVTSATDRAAAE
jgi:LysM repeat protein